MWKEGYGNYQLTIVGGVIQSTSRFNIDSLIVNTLKEYGIHLPTPIMNPIKAPFHRTNGRNIPIVNIANIGPPNTPPIVNST